MYKKLTANRSVLYFFALVVFQALASNFAHPVTPTLIQSLNMPDYMFGLLFAAMSGTNFLISPFWGKLADYVDSKIIMAIGCIGYALGQFLFWQSTTPAAMIFARFVSGFFVAGFGVCTLTYLVNTSDASVRGARLTFFAAIQAVSSSFGYLIGGLLGEISISLSFGLQVICIVLCGIGLVFLLEHDKKGNKAFSKTEFVRNVNPFSAFLAGRQFMTLGFAMLFLVILFATFASTAFDQCFNYYIKDQFGMTSAYNGTIKAATGIISLVANMTLCMYIIKKTNIKHSITKLLLMGIFFMIGVVSTESIVVFITFTVLCLALNAITVPIFQSMVTDRTTAANSNLVMGFFNSIKSLGGVFGALLAGFIYEIGPKYPFYFAAAAFGLAFVFALVYIAVSKNSTKA